MSNKRIYESSMMISLKIMKVLLWFIICIGLSGCVSLAPWERGNLAKPQMAIDPHPLQDAMRGHNYSSREAGASDNASGGGGGCGCF